MPNINLNFKFIRQCLKLTEEEFRKKIYSGHIRRDKTIQDILTGIEKKLKNLGTHVGKGQ